MQYDSAFNRILQDYSFLGFFSNLLHFAQYQRAKFQTRAQRVRTVWTARPCVEKADVPAASDMFLDLSADAVSCLFLLCASQSNLSQRKQGKHKKIFLKFFKINN